MEGRVAIRERERGREMLIKPDMMTKRGQRVLT
jgi:hypothetical protein